MSASGESPVSVSWRRSRALRVGEPRQHAHLLVAQARDLVLEGDQVLLRRLGLGRRARASSAVERARRRRRGASRRPISASATASSSRSTAMLELARARAQLRRVAARARARACCAGRGRRPRPRGACAYCSSALLDRGLVDRAGVAVLAAADPVREQRRGRGSQTRAKSRIDDLLRVASVRSASSAVMPSSRIFCWKFWRYMPISSAALVMLPPWRRSAWTRKSRSKRRDDALLGLAERCAAIAGRGVRRPPAPASRAASPSRSRRRDLRRRARAAAPARPPSAARARCPSTRAPRRRAAPRR